MIRLSENKKNAALQVELEEYRKARFLEQSAREDHRRGDKHSLYHAYLRPTANAADTLVTCDGEALCGQSTGTFLRC